MVRLNLLFFLCNKKIFNYFILFWLNKKKAGPIGMHVIKYDITKSSSGPNHISSYLSFGPITGFRHRDPGRRRRRRQRRRRRRRGDERCRRRIHGRGAHSFRPSLASPPAVPKNPRPSLPRSPCSSSPSSSSSRAPWICPRSARRSSAPSDRRARSPCSLPPIIGPR